MEPCSSTKWAIRIPQNQAALLRAVEMGELRPMGAEQDSRVDVRIIAATNRFLHLPPSQFRTDLYHRLAGTVIDIPPLRARIEDIPVLAIHFLEQAEGGAHGRPTGFTPAALERLQAHAWPGNVRELRNVVDRAARHAGDGLVDAENIDLQQLDAMGQPAALLAAEFQRAELRTLLARHDGDVARVAEALGIARSTLYYRMQKYGIVTPRRHRSD